MHVKRERQTLSDEPGPNSDGFLSIVKGEHLSLVAALLTDILMLAGDEGDPNDEVLPVCGKGDSLSFANGRECGVSGSLFPTRFNLSKVWCNPIWLSVGCSSLVPAFLLPFLGLIPSRGFVRCLFGPTARFDAV